MTDHRLPMRKSGVDNSPSDAPEFVELMVREAEQIIPRKRNHPSLAIWYGGNELQAGPEQPLDDNHPVLAALKATVERLDPDRHWLPTSSSGRLFSNSLDNITKDPFGLHDVHGPHEHQGLTKHFTLYNQGTSLLNGEFGVEGITNYKSLSAAISKEHQHPVNLNNPYWFHLGAWWVKEPMWRAMFGEIFDVETLAGAVQLSQADGLRYATEANWRRQYQNSGSLPWQFNEPYPMAACTSAVDYFGQPKPAYYAIAHAYEPVHLSAKFPTQAWEGRTQFEAEVWGSNANHYAIESANLEMKITSVSGRVYEAQQKTVSLRADGSAPFATLGWPLSALEEDGFFLDLRLDQPDGALLSRNRYVFSRTRDLAPLLAVPGTQLEIQKTEQDDRWELTITNTGPQTALFVWLQDDRPPGSRGDAYFDDNHFCLFPGEARMVRVGWKDVPPAERRLDITGWNT